MTQRPLYEHQQKALEMLRESLSKGKKRPILQASTGFGKTRLAGEIISNATSKGKRVTFVVPRKSLVDQTVQSFYRDGIIDIGVIQADHHMTDWSKPVQVASIQTVHHRGYPKSDIVIVDEAHMLYKGQIQWIQDHDFRDVPFIGLTATPWTKGLGKYYDDLLIASTTQDLINKGFLSKFRVFTSEMKVNLNGVKVTGGDYNEKQLDEAMNKSSLVADVVETWLKKGDGRQTLCFAVTCQHAQALQAQFEQAGIPCGYIDAHTKDDDRTEIFNKFKSGRHKVLCNVGVLTTGVDLDVRCIILATSTKSEILFTQIIGRGLRTADGKDDCIIIDHGNTHKELGFVTDIYKETLDDGKPNRAEKSKKKKVKEPRECPDCHALIPVGIFACPECGYTPKAKDLVAVVDGELKEFKGSPQSDIPRNMIKIGGKLLHKGNFFGQLKQHALTRGYKPGWAALKFKEFTGEFPNYAIEGYDPEEITPQVASWITSRAIAWAKSQRKLQNA